MNLKDYIHGKRHGKEANRLERKAMNDPFLQDAIDGFDSVPGDHFFNIEKLEKQLAPQTKRIDKRVWMWAAAAVLVLLIGIPFLLRQPGVKEIQIASSETVKQEETAVLSPEKDTVLVADVARPEIKEEKIHAPAPAVVQERAPESRETFVQPEKTVAIIEPEQITATTTQAKQEVIQRKAVAVTTASNTKLVSGKIVDETGEPIIGATVMVKDANNGTVSDIDGNFRLTVPKNEEGILIASYVGMENTETPLKENLGNIVMKEDTELLSEVVVVGYGTQKKVRMTGSVSQAKDTVPVFGETEFVQYFEENYDKTICADEPISVKVEFYVNAQGQPGNIVIKENSCPDLETEIKRLLLGSPPWSKTNRKVTLNILLNEQQ